MNAHVIFASSFGEYLLYGWFLPLIAAILLTGIIFSFAYLVLFIMPKFENKIKDEIMFYVHWRMNISKIVWKFRKPVVETVTYSNGKVRTRHYYF